MPYLAGGGVDTAARVVGQKLGQAFGQSVIVDNKPGGATNIGSDFVAKSTPDGYTLLRANSSQVANVSIYSKMPYDLRKASTLIGKATSNSIRIPASLTSFPMRAISFLM